MLRTWLIPLCAVVLIAGLVLYFTRDERSADGSPNAGRAAPATVKSPTLTDGEVRAYIRIWPRIQEVGGRSAHEMAAAVARGEPFDPQAAAARSRALIDSFLREHHLSNEDWESLRSRVENVVRSVRWEARRPERERELEDQIARKELLMPNATGKQRQSLERELDRLRSEVGAPGPRLAEEDVALVKSYWAQLEPLVRPTQFELKKNG